MRYVDVDIVSCDRLIWGQSTHGMPTAVQPLVRWASQAGPRVPRQQKSRLYAVRIGLIHRTPRPRTRPCSLLLWAVCRKKKGYHLSTDWSRGCRISWPRSRNPASIAAGLMRAAGSQLTYLPCGNHHRVTCVFYQFGLACVDKNIE